MSPKILLVTGSSGLIGSEVCAYFARELGYQVHGVDNNQRAVFFGPPGDTRWNQRRLQREPAGLRPSRTRHPRPGRRARAGPAAQARRHRAHRRPAEPRPRRGHPVRRLRHQRRRHAQPARGRAPGLPRVAVRAHVDQQGLRRRAQRDPARGTRHALGLRRPGLRPRHPRDLHHRPVEALALRRLQGGRRRHGAGVRPLFRHAHLLPARRLPHRARTTPASSCTASSATS